MNKNQIATTATTVAPISKELITKINDSVTPELVKSITSTTKRELTKVNKATSPVELERAAQMISEMKIIKENAEALRKQILGDFESKLTIIGEAIESLTDAVKGKFLETKEIVQGLEKRIINDDNTGQPVEVLKIVSINNYNDKVFSFTPAKEDNYVDYNAIIDKFNNGTATKEDKEKFGSFVKEVKTHVVDNKELNNYIVKNDITDLPKQVKPKDSRVGIQSKRILKDLIENKGKTIFTTPLLSIEEDSAE